jgi:ankyrin repeat protein
MIAVTEGHRDAVRLLIDAKADVNARTTLIAAPPATTGNLQGVGRAQNREPPVPQGGMTPLLYAARDGRLEIARMLVGAGANVRAMEGNNTSALLIAIVNGQVGVARLLVEQGADVNTADGFGRTPLWGAVDLRNLDFDGNGRNGVDRAATLELIGALLEKGASVNARTRVEPPSRRWMMGFGARAWVDPAGQTPFVRAALAGDVTVMKMLLARGADPEISTNSGVTALMAASGVGWVPQQTYTESPADLLEAVKMTAGLGLDVTAADAKGYTAAHGAAYRGSDEIVQFLAEQGASLTVKDKAGKTPAAIADGTAYLGGTPLERKASTIALIEKLSRSQTPR